MNKATLESPSPATTTVSWVESLILIFMLVAAYSLTAVRIMCQPVDCDELENLHAAYLWQQGLQPHSHFFQNHSACYFLLLRPIVWHHDRQLADAIVAARVLSWIIVGLTIAAAWSVACRWLNDRPIAWWAAVAWAWCCSLSERSIHARPDLLMLLCLLVGIDLTVQSLWSAGPSSWTGKIRAGIGRVVAPGEQRLPLRREPLNPTLGAFGRPRRLLAIERQKVRTRKACSLLSLTAELTGGAAVPAPLPQELAGGREGLDPMIVFQGRL